MGVLRTDISNTLLYATDDRDYNLRTHGLVCLLKTKILRLHIFHKFFKYILPIITTAGVVMK